MRIVNIYKNKKTIECGVNNPIVKKSKRRFGVLKGKIKIAKDFGAPLPDEFVEAFEA